MVLIINSKKVLHLYLGKDKVSIMYLGKTKIYEATNSCFGSGYWIGKKPWIGTDAWKKLKT